MHLNGIRVYVAGPYTKPDPVINTSRAIEAANHLLDMGFVPFLPHLTLLWHLVCPRPYEEWLTYDNEWVTQCHCVLRLPGESSGADKEVELAKSIGLPVYYSCAELTCAASSLLETVAVESNKRGSAA